MDKPRVMVTPNARPARPPEWSALRTTRAGRGRPGHLGRRPSRFGRFETERPAIRGVEGWISGPDRGGGRTSGVRGSLHRAGVANAGHRLGPVEGAGAVRDP